MNSLRQLLWFLALPLAAVSSVCAEPFVDTVPAAQPSSEIVSVAPLENQGVAPTLLEQDSAPPAAGSKAADVAAPVAASESAAEFIKVSRLEPEVTVSVAMTAEDRQLEQRKTDFLKFAARKLKDMNRNHILSRERMRIEKRPEGGYKASFHQLDDSSMSCQVSRSPSKGAQYVAVLSYKERVYTASCPSPADCRQGAFTPAEVIPNRHIFVFNNGVWQ